MIYNTETQQWTLLPEEKPCYGQELIAQILSSGKEVLPAGTIMVFEWHGTPYLMFQTLLGIVLPTAAHQTLIAYEPGSVVFFRPTDDKQFVPTLRFRDCRLPNKKEIEFYTRQKTI